MTGGGVKERQGEGRGGRKGREAGRLGHEEGHLTDIAAIAINTHIHTHTCRHRQTHTCTLSWIGPCTVAALFYPLLSLVLHPFFSSEQEDKRDTEEEE